MLRSGIHVEFRPEGSGGLRGAAFLSRITAYMRRSLAENSSASICRDPHDKQNISPALSLAGCMLVTVGYISGFFRIILGGILCSHP